MKTMHTLAAFATLAAAAQPALAADDFRYIEARPEHRTAAFAGARLRIPLGAETRRARPSARLHLGMEHVYEDRRIAAPAQAFRTSALELGFSRRSGPTFFIGGAPVGEVERRVGISTGGAIAIGVGATVLAALLLVAVSDPPEFEFSD